MDVLLEWMLSQALAKPALLALIAVVAFSFVKTAPGTRRPPLVSYWIPWLGSAITLGKDPDRFFKRATYVFDSLVHVIAPATEVSFQ